MGRGFKFISGNCLISIFSGRAIMKSTEELLERIVVDPKVMVGKPVVRGTRVTVEHVLTLLAQGLTVEDILKDYPHLTRDDVAAVLLYAAKVTGREEVFPVTVE